MANATSAALNGRSDDGESEAIAAGVLGTVNSQIAAGMLGSGCRAVVSACLSMPESTS